MPMDMETLASEDISRYADGIVARAAGLPRNISPEDRCRILALAGKRLIDEANALNEILSDELKSQLDDLESQLRTCKKPTELV